MAPEDQPISQRTSERQKRSKIDWDAFRTRSLLPGGFGAERAQIWPQLLNVRGKELPLSDETPKFTVEQLPHQDERQIGLDTDRSFVLYPVDPKADREALQGELHDLLVSLFRKRPRLSYFQGFHDIVSVFYLTLPQETRLACVEKLSLHRLRDAMGPGLEPVLGLLRVAKILLRLEDKEYAHVLEQSAPLPFFALSNLLTLFAHDVPTLPLIQHVFDYLLCRPPVASVYLASAVILARKKEAVRLAEEDEEGMIHSLLSSLPKLSDGDHLPVNELADDSASEPDSRASTTFMLENISSAATSPPPASPEPIEAFHDETQMHPESSGDKTRDTMGPIAIGEPVQGISFKEVTKPVPDTAPDDTSAGATNHTGDHTVDGSPSTILECSVDGPPVDSSINERGETVGTHSDTLSESQGVEPALDRHTTLETQNHATEEPLVALTDLLKHADALYANFPPSHSALRLSSILGPQSVVFTWSDDFSDLPSDDEAEAMVQHPELVVYPYIDVPETGKEETSNVEDGTEDEAIEVRGFWGLRRRKGKEKTLAPNAAVKRRKRKLRRPPFSQIEKRTMVAGTVLVLGVTVAIYGIKLRNEGAGGLSFSFVKVREQTGSQSMQIPGLAGWAAGMFSAMSHGILEGLGYTGGERG